jgi:hypothetical protein
MTPKTPAELKEQIERENEKTSEAGYERTAEGMETPTPSEDDFFANLEKASQPKKPEP